MATPAPRSATERIADTTRRLEHDNDAWVATASDAKPWLVPLSFHWTGESLLMATARRNNTYQNLTRERQARLALGDYRDVVMIDGEVDLPDRLPDEQADAIRAKSGLDPRTDPGAGYIRVRPLRIDAWRTAPEVANRTIMRDGDWLS